jgi:hypothetical protein
VLEPEIREHRSLINVRGDLLGAALRGDVLSARELRAATGTSQADEVTGDQWHGAPRTLLPRRVGSRVNDDLADDSPTRVMRIASRDEKPCQRLGHPDRSRLGSVAVEMPQCGPYLTAVVDRPGQLAGGRWRLAWSILDPSTVLAPGVAAIDRAAATPLLRGGAGRAAGRPAH